MPLLQAAGLYIIYSLVMLGKDWPFLARCKNQNVVNNYFIKGTGRIEHLLALQMKHQCVIVVNIIIL